MKAGLATAVLALTLVATLLLAGQWLTVSEEAPTVVSWLGLNWAYLKNLGPEIGGSGIDAVLIGGIAGFFANRLARWQEVERQRKSIIRRRRRGRMIDLVEELANYGGMLPLWGQTFTGLEIKDLDLSGTKFSNKGKSPSTLTNLTFKDCDLTSIDFRSCVLMNVRFENCLLDRCDLRGATITVDDGKQSFATTHLVRCRFEEVMFTSVDLKDVDQRGCSFWGASFNGGSRMPTGVYRYIVPDDLRDSRAGSADMRLASKREFLTRPTIERVLFLIREMLALAELKAGREPPRRSGCPDAASTIRR